MLRKAMVWVVGVGLLSTGCRQAAPARPAARPPIQRPPGPALVERPPAPAPPPPSRRPPGEPGWYPPGGISKRWKTIVVHHSATATGNARTFDRAHRDKGWEELGYHFVIGNGSTSGDGVVEVGGRWRTQKHGAHCKTPDNFYNDHGIGICLVGDFNKSRPTPRQMASLQRLVAFLSDQCRIPDSRVTTHGLVTNKTQCPGRNFPILSLRRSLALNNRGRNYAQ
jgi:hypothetical protein